MSKLLILGGTADARYLTEQILSIKEQNKLNLNLIYSVAGLVRTPNLDCEILVGGFQKRAGLSAYIKAEGIDAILDATHPYAAKISATAYHSAIQLSIPYWNWQRPAWQAQAQDNWQHFADWPSLIPALANKQHVFLSAGQLTETVLVQLLTQQKNAQQQLTLRTAVPSRVTLPNTVHWVKGIGPFQLEQETQLLSELKIDALVTKNSGGSATSAKLIAARNLGVEVFMLDRPLTEQLNSYIQPEQLLEVIRHWLLEQQQEAVNEH